MSSETEKLYDELLGKGDEAEEKALTDEETPTDEQPEDETEQQAITEYTAKIEALDERLAELKTEKTTDIRRKAMKDAKYSEDQIDRYVKFIEGDSKKEAEQSVRYFDISPANNSYIDPTPMGGGDGKPRRKDSREIGRKAIERVLDKIRL